MGVVWRILWQAALGAAIAAVVAVLWARFLPASHPWLERAGVLQPMKDLGLVPPPAEAPAAPGRGGPPGGFARGPVNVLAEPPGEARAFDRVAAIGTGQARHAVTVTAEVAGRIVAVPVASGTRVQAGDVIAVLDREAQDIAVARARLVLDDARDRLDRVERLRATGSATDLQIREADLALRQAELALREAEYALSRRDVRAPIAGSVGIIGIEAGEQVTAATEIARIDDRAVLVVEFRVPERFVGQIGPGDVVTVRPLARAEDTLSGVIVALDNRVEVASRTIRVQAEVDNPGDALRAGMAFEIGLDVEGPRHPTVPPLAVQWGNSGAFVWIVREGKAARLPVRIVQRTASAVLVQAAFQPGDLVVREGVQALRPGAEVATGGPAAAAGGARPRT
ncbi:MAG: efflux RND transporter periplasmic adaptor subunit [Gemmobacter sp.]